MKEVYFYLAGGLGSTLSLHFYIASKFAAKFDSNHNALLGKKKKTFVAFTVACFECTTI